MRNSFLSKIDLINAELSNTKLSYRKQIQYYEEELKQEKYIKELFLRQVTEFQKMFQVKS
jgi:hypothetical protein